MQIIENYKDFQVIINPYNHLKVAAVKQIPGRVYYQKESKSWHVPKNKRDYVYSLKDLFPDATIVFDKILPDKKPKQPQQLGAVPDLPELDFDIPLKRVMFPFQGPGAAYCINNRRVIIGDQPGLGKTTQAIATVIGLHIKQKNPFPVIVVCPSSLKLNWQREWMEVAGKKAMILKDSVKTTWQQYYKVGWIDVFIVNIESVKKFFVNPKWEKPEGKFLSNQIPFLDVKDIFKTIIIDESHRLRNPHAQSTKFVLGMARGKETILELTGTPVVNTPMDLIPQLVIADRLRDIVSHIPREVDRHGKEKDYSGYERFKARYCGGPKGRGTYLEELNYRLRRVCYYRREKSQVLKDLPPKMRQIILCEISTRKEYDAAEKEFRELLTQYKNSKDYFVRNKLKGLVLVRIGALKQLSARGKLEAIQEYVEEVVSGGEKIVLFCSLRFIGDKLMEANPGFEIIRGGMSDEAKAMAEKRFQTNPKVKGIICSIKAAGVGLNLFASSRPTFVEFPWTSADCDQCGDRCHRIGTVDSVLEAYFLGENTIDRFCYDIINRKRNMANTVSGAEDEIEDEIIDELYNLFNQNKK